jgi:hypothetical protein
MNQAPHNLKKRENYVWYVLKLSNQAAPSIGGGIKA